jgi:hypothetical protein
MCCSSESVSCTNCQLPPVEDHPEMLRKELCDLADYTSVEKSHGLLNSPRGEGLHLDAPAEDGVVHAAEGQISIHDEIDPLKHVHGCLVEAEVRSHGGIFQSASRIYLQLEMVQCNADNKRYLPLSSSSLAASNSPLHLQPRSSQLPGRLSQGAGGWATARMPRAYEGSHTQCLCLCACAPQTG